MSALQAALSLAEEWSLPVFPCNRDKQPMTECGFKDASRNVCQIDDWWRTYPDALIGVPTGKASNLLVVDVDPAGARWYCQHFTTLSPGRVHHTPRGHHLLYRMPDDDDIRCSTSKVSPGVDVRAEGGYVIWWPAEGLDVVGDLADITLPPSALLAKLRAPTTIVSTVNGSSNQHIAEGGRNDGLTRLAGRMRRAGASVEELREALGAMNAHRCAPPLAAGEVERIAASVARYEPAKDSTPREASPVTWLCDADVHADVPFTVSKLLPQGALAVMYGPPNAGKSTLALDLAFAIARGADWRGLQTRGGLVYYSAAEGRVGVERRLCALLKQHPEGRGAPLCCDWNTPNLRNPAVVVELVERIKASQSECGERCALVVIDTLTRHLYGSDNDPEHMAELIAAGDALRREFGCAVLIVHHSGKDVDRGARGHSSLLGACDTEIEVTDTVPHWLKVTKQRDADRLPALAFELNPVNLGRDVAGDDITAVVIEHRDLAPPKPEPKGHHQRAVLNELERRAKAGDVAWPKKQIAEIARELGVSKTSSFDIPDALVKGAYLKLTIGGYSLT